MKTAVGFRYWRKQVLQNAASLEREKQKNGDDDMVSVDDGTTTVVTGGATVVSDLHRPGAVAVGGRLHPVVSEQQHHEEHCSGDGDATSMSTGHHEDRDFTEQGMVGSTADVVNSTVQSTTAVEAYPVEEENPQLVKATVVRNRKRNLLIAAIIVLIALAIGLGVGLTQGPSSTSSSPDPEGELLVSFLLEGGNEMSGGGAASYNGLFEDARMWRTFGDDGEELLRLRGNFFSTRCRVLPCIENDGACKVGPDLYEEGCCLGVDCDEDVKCGEQCPDYACVPDFDTCMSPQCHTCRKGSQGEELFKMDMTYSDIHCIDYGTELSLETGEEYDWIVMCWKIVSGGTEEMNYGNGEYKCNAARKGAGIKTVISDNIPCQFIQLGECGCAPSDVHTFGLDPPTKSCRTQDDCPFLCSDVPDSDPQLLCEAFGGIRWWEGENFVSMSAFNSIYNETWDDKFELTIYEDK